MEKTKNNPRKLHDEFVRLGGMRHKLKNKMLAILPEIYESGIWKKYAGSIVEYAGKYGDIAKTTVIKRLRLEENLEGLPCLKAAIEKVGVHKVAMVAKIATPETDQRLAETLLDMSKMAVQSLSKELRAGQSEPDHQSPSCKAVPITKKIELDENTSFLFLKLKAKLDKNLSDKEFLKLILEEREKQEFPRKQVEEPEDQKSVTGDTFATTRVPHTNQKKELILDYTLAEPTTRYIPIKKKRTVIAKTNGKCAYPNCNAPYEILHHANRYSQSKSHDSIIPLCKIHHEFAHNGFIKNETQKSNKWRIADINRPTTKIPEVDVLYRKYRRGALA